MRFSRQLLLLYTLLTAGLMLGLFMLRSVIQSFCTNYLGYAEAILGLTSVLVVSYFWALRPDTRRGEGTFNWYLARGLAMSFASTLLATLLIGLYAYHADAGYFARRLDWEQQALEQQHVPAEMQALFLADEAQVERLHLEELGFCGQASVANLLATLTAAGVFFPLAKRRRFPPVVPA